MSNGIMLVEMNVKVQENPSQHLLHGVGVRVNGCLRATAAGGRSSRLPRTLSEVYTLRGLKYTATTGLPFAHPICPERAFQQRWQDLLAPLDLAPAVSTLDPKATGISWPWASWQRYIASQPPLCRMINWSFPLTFIVTGDGYPSAGGEWSQLSVSIANMGLWGRILARVWVIGLAMRGDKAMATLATLWEDNIKVCRVHTVLFRQRSDKLFRRRSGDLQVFCWNRHRNNLVPTKLMFFCQAIQEVVDTHRVVFNSHEEAADAWLGGDSSWVRRIIGITPAPQVGSLYNEGIWDSDAAVRRGKDVVRTTESDHVQRTSFSLGTPSLKAAGCSVEPQVVILRCRVVMCILHCCMAMGRLQMTNIERLAAERLAGGAEVSRAAIQAVLHEHHTWCRLGKDCSPDGEETSRLFAA